MAGLSGVRDSAVLREHAVADQTLRLARPTTMNTLPIISRISMSSISSIDWFQKVYRADSHGREFPEYLIHALSAAAEEHSISMPSSLTRLTRVLSIAP